MARKHTSLPYRFLLPQVREQPVGNQGELAKFIPYRLQDDLTPEQIREELLRQPHFKPLADQLSFDRTIYLIESSSRELLLLAAEYIGTFHALANNRYGYYDNSYSEDADDDAAESEREDAWRDGDTNTRIFDFGTCLPLLHASELREYYQPDNDVGFGFNMYSMDQSHRSNPWWTLNLSAPVAIQSGFQLSLLPSLVNSMSMRSLIIILHQAAAPEEDGDFGGFSNPHAMTMADLGFELETEMIRLIPPAVDSPYKRQVLRQIASARSAPLPASANTASILRLIADARGNADNQTISKAVANALLRHKGASALSAADFRYLATTFASRKKADLAEKQQPMIGQQAVRDQLDRIVASMVFQKKRQAMGLPADRFHYNFAFLGAPGTGKTTWALHLAQEMQKHGLLDNTESICLNAAELKARYVGHTTGKVKALFDQYGVIILDEAYSLAEGDGFGEEALAQLCVELEKHEGDRLVVFAGYGGGNDPADNRMLQFLQSNPGINSRISFKIHFGNFSAEELTEVFHAMLTHSGYAVPREADGSIIAFFRGRMQQRAFGNCREARNLADRVKILMASRLHGKDGCSPADAAAVLPGDIHAAIGEIEAEYAGLRRNSGLPIGFGRGGKL